MSSLEVASVGGGGSVVATVDAGDGTGRDSGVAGRDSASAALIVVGVGHGSTGSTLVRVVTDVRSVTIVSKALLLDDSGVGTDSSVTRVSGIVRRANSAGGGRDGSNGSNTLLGVVVSRGSVVLLSEKTALLGGAGSVVVVRAGSESLLLLVVAHESELHEGGDQEQKSSDDGNSEDSSVELASSTKVGGVGDVALVVGSTAVGRSVTKRSSDIATAAVGTTAGQDSNGDEATHAKKVEDQAEDGKESNTSQAAGEKSGSESVQDCNTRDTLNGLPSGRNVEVVIRENGKEVTEDTENDGGTAESECIKCSLQQTKSASLEDTHDD